MEENSCRLVRITVPGVNVNELMFLGTEINVNVCKSKYIYYICRSLIHPRKAMANVMDARADKKFNTSNFVYARNLIARTDCIYVDEENYYLRHLIQSSRYCRFHRHQVADAETWLLPFRDDLAIRHIQCHLQNMLRQLIHFLRSYLMYPKTIFKIKWSFIAASRIMTIYFRQIHFNTSTQQYNSKGVKNLKTSERQWSWIKMIIQRWKLTWLVPMCVCWSIKILGELRTCIQNMERFLDRQLCLSMRME